MKTSIKINRQITILVFLLCSVFNGISQGGFSLPEGVKKDRMSFNLVNNLVVIPVEVNGIELSFLLDTGVSSTIMFSLSEVDSLELNNAKSVRLRGLGEGGSIPALKSKKNTLKIGQAIDENHTVYVVFDKSLNLSTRMGIPIHGIVGYEFFKKLVVKTNYNSRKLTFYNPALYEEENCNKCEELNLTFQNKKPFIDVIIEENGNSMISTLLIDSGSSDAIWLFDNEYLKTELENKYFDDFLGQGLSGEIYGRRSKLPKFTIGNFELSNVKVAFPTEESMENIKMFEDRDGSLGGDLLRRFTVIFNYPSRKILLKKNNKFKDPFHYNMSGLVIKHDGVVVAKDEKSKYNRQDFEQEGKTNISVSTVYDFYLVPRFVVSEIRKGSPAEEAGIMINDEIISVNGKSTYKFKLPEIIGLFASKAGKKITMKVKRNGIVYKKKFYLKAVF